MTIIITHNSNLKSKYCGFLWVLWFPPAVKKKKNMLVGEFKSPLVVFECVKVYVPDAV